MPTPTELQRLAAATNQLRPDWPLSSLLTFLTTHHAPRAYTDLAVALAIVATDPNTRTPARLNEAGPWWQVTNSKTSNRVGPGREPHCTKPGHEHELARACRCCRGDALAAQREDDEREADYAERAAGER